MRSTVLRLIAVEICGRAGDTRADQPLGGHSTVLLNARRGCGPWVARLGLRGSTGEYAGNRPKTVRRSNSAFLATCKSWIRWRSLPDSNRCTSLERPHIPIGSVGDFSCTHIPCL